MSETYHYNRELADKFSQLIQQYVRKSPVKHKRKLKSGKVIEVKGRAEEPEGVKPLFSYFVPKEAELKTMSAEELRKVYNLVQKLSEDYKGKEKLERMVFKYWNEAELKKAEKVKRAEEKLKAKEEKMREEKLKAKQTDEWGNTPEDRKELKRFAKMIENCIPQFTEKELITNPVLEVMAKIRGKPAPKKRKEYDFAGWKDCTAEMESPKDQDSLNEFKKKIQKVAFDRLKKTMFFIIHGGSFYIATRVKAKRGLGSDPFAKKLYDEPRMGAGVQGFRNLGTGVIVVGGNKYRREYERRTGGYESNYVVHVMFHEFGHDYYYNALTFAEKADIGEFFQAQVTEWMNKGGTHKTEDELSSIYTMMDFFPSDYALNNSKEFFSECFGFYFAEPKRFKEKYPKLYSFVEKHLK